MLILSILMNILVMPHFFVLKMGILSIDLNNINLDDTNYEEDYPKTIIHIRLLAWYIKYEKAKHLKKVK